MSNIDKVKVGNTIYPITDSRVGDLTNLDTTEKNTLVGAINEVASGSTGGDGLTDDIKEALLACFEKVAWIDEDGQDYYDALYNALYPPANLVSISAVYTQSGTVYDTDSLDSLKSDLVVTAHYSDSSTSTVASSAYTLSGTLTAGTSTVTVTHGGKTTTFTVTVTAYVAPYDMWTSGVAYSPQIISGEYYKASNGAITEYAGWDRTDYMPCHGASTIVVSPLNEEGTGTPASNCFFDASYTPVETNVRLSKTQATTLTVPATACYFGMSSNSSALSACLVSGVTPYS